MFETVDCVGGAVVPFFCSNSYLIFSGQEDGALRAAELDKEFALLAENLKI
jgi:hypothetical protein